MVANFVKFYSYHLLDFSLFACEFNFNFADASSKLHAGRLGMRRVVKSSRCSLRVSSTQSTATATALWTSLS